MLMLLYLLCFLSALILAITSISVFIAHIYKNPLKLNNRMKSEEIIKTINDLQLIQTDYAEDFEFPSEIESALSECHFIQSGIDIQEHRWYETSIYVYYTSEGEYFGIRYVTKLYSESSNISDIHHIIKAFPMKRIHTVTYVKS
jgi:hypothetical protein